MGATRVVMEDSEHASREELLVRAGVEEVGAVAEVYTWE
jgi:hypothetical protein